MIETDLDLARPHGVDTESGRGHRPNFKIGRKFRYVITGQQVIDEFAVLRGDHGVERCERCVLSPTFAHVIHRHGEVDAIGLAVDVFVDPVQLNLELLRPKSQCAEHTKSSGVGDGSDDVATMREGEDWKFDSKTLGDRSAHGFPFDAVLGLADHVRHKICECEINVAR